MKRLLFITLLSLTSLAQAAAIDAGGARFEDRIRIGANELQLNGAGIRSRFFLSVYAVGLYLGERKGNAPDAIASTGTKRLQLQVLRDLTATQFVDALMEAFRNNNEGPQAEVFKGRLEELKANMLSINAAKKGDVIHLDWLPEQGTRVTLNGKAIGKEIAGEDFYRALMKIWLGPKAVQESLKDALLGKPQ